MATVYTSSLKLGVPAQGDRGWGNTANTTFQTIDALSPIAGGNVTTFEVPSSTLKVLVAPSSVLKPDGTVGSYAGGNTTLTANTTNYLYLNSALALNVNTSSWPAGQHYRLANCITNSTTVTSISDSRLTLQPAGVPYLPLAGGEFADAAYINTTTTSGSIIAGNTTQKLGFWGKPAVSQPTNAAQSALTDSTGGTASGTYTLAAIGAGGSYSQADIEAIRNSISTLTVLLNRIRLDLVAVGIIKGS